MLELPLCQKMLTIVYPDNNYTIKFHTKTSRKTFNENLLILVGWTSLEWIIGVPRARGSDMSRYHHPKLRVCAENLSMADCKPNWTNVWTQEGDLQSG